jgi:hypothetical protein
MGISGKDPTETFKSITLHKIRRAEGLKFLRNEGVTYVTGQGVTEQGACCGSCNVKTDFCFKGLRIKPIGKLA